MSALSLGFEKSALVRFERYNTDDIECAEINFPDTSRQVALVEQFKRELRDNDRLSGCEVVHYTYTEENLILLAVVPHTFSKGELVKAIQHGYDEFGMNGHFEVLTEDYGEEKPTPPKTYKEVLQIYSTDDLPGRAWNENTQLSLLLDFLEAGGAGDVPEIGVRNFIQFLNNFIDEERSAGGEPLILDGQEEADYPLTVEK